MERNPKQLKYTKDGSYSNEYFALKKAKKDIKDKIKEYVEMSIIFPEIIKIGENSIGSRVHGINPSKIDLDPDLKKYELTGDEGSVREEISDEAKEFVRDVFDEDTIERLLNVTLNHGYLKKGKNVSNMKPNDVKSRKYRINLAKKMVNAGIVELKLNLDYAYSDILSQDLDRALGICNAIDKKISDQEWEMEQIRRTILANRRRR